MITNRSSLSVKLIFCFFFISLLIFFPVAGNPEALNAHPTDNLDVDHSNHKVHTAQENAKAINVKLLDLELLNQDSKRVKFKSDVIGDRIVAMTFTYTTCTTICPVLDAIFVKLQNKLENRLGSGIQLITMSIDPVTDIPVRMKEYQKRIKAKPGWEFLTGKKEDINRILIGLDVYAPDILQHPPSVLVGDGRTGIWRRFYGFPTSEDIMMTIKELEDARR